MAATRKDCKEETARRKRASSLRAAGEKTWKVLKSTTPQAPCDPARRAVSYRRPSS